MRAAVAVACLSLVGITSAGEAQAAIRQPTHIAAQELASALKLLAENRNVQLVYRSDLVKHQRSGGAAGDLTFEEALTQLLTDTGLAYKYLENNAITIVPVSSASASLPPVYLAQNSAPPPSSGNGGEEGRTTLDEVVVTAQKREERLQDVPISISVLRGEVLDSSADRGVAEGLSRVPSVFVPGSTARGSGTPAIVIRGASAAGVGAGTTAYYLDSTSFGRARTPFVPDSNPYDLDRVEVLRGPQGTLYGASALNGVVRVLTRNPDFQDFEFKARGSLASTDHGGESYSGDAAFNFPLIADKLAARLVLGYQELGGWIDKPRLPAEDANDTEKSNVRVKLAARLTDSFSAGVSAWFSRTDIGAPPLSDDGGYNMASRTVPGHPEYVGFHEPASTDFDSYTLDLGYVTSVVAIKSATSYLDYADESITDRTYTNTMGAFAPATTRNFSGSRVFSEELVLNSAGDGPWRWTAGFMYRDAQDSTKLKLANVPPYDDYIVKSTSTAFFGDLTRTFAGGRYELTGGLRHFRDEVKNQEYSRSTAPNPQGIPVGGLLTIEKTFTKTTPRVVASWHPDKDATFYASYSQGFRSGLPQTFLVMGALPNTPPAGPDTLTNYEIGAKVSALGGRLSIDSALYYIDWKDAQQTVTETIAGFPIPLPIFVNGESASGIGADLAVMFTPVDSLTMGFNVGWNDLAYDADVISSGVVVFPEGNRRTNSPQTTAGVSFDYIMPLGGGYRGRLSASANYVAEQITGTARSSSTSYRLFTARSMTVVRPAFVLEAPRHWRATLYVDNATDETGFQPDPNAPGFAPEYGVYMRPRTYGIQLEYRH